MRGRGGRRGEDGGGKGEAGEGGGGGEKEEGGGGEEDKGKNIHTYINCILLQIQK